LRGLREIVIDPGSSLVDQVRSLSAIFTLHAGMFAVQDLEGDPEEQSKAVLEVATDMITQAHAGTKPAENES